MKTYRATVRGPGFPNIRSFICTVSGRMRADAIMQAQQLAGKHWSLLRYEIALLKVQLELLETVDERDNKADRVCRGLAQLVVEYGNEGRVSLVDKVRGVLNEVAADRALAARLYDALTSEGAK